MSIVKFSSLRAMIDPLIIQIHVIVMQGCSVNRGSYMSAHVLLNLFNKLWKRDKMLGLLSI